MDPTRAKAYIATSVHRSHPPIMGKKSKKKSKSTGTAADALEFYRHATVKARKMKGLDVDEEEEKG